VTATSRSWSAPAPPGSAAGAIEAHHGEIYAWARRIVGSHHDALDVVQDVCVRCVDQWASDPPAHVRGWLRRVTVNRAIDLVRGRAGGRAAEARKQAAAPSPGGAAPADDGRRGDLIDAIERLTDQQRHVLLAKVLDELTFAEIAAELAIAVPTAKTHYLRAVRALRDRLEPRSHEP
jgi:RNA polymerase sigma-70 factor (ECF subfamily)